HRMLSDDLADRYQSADEILPLLAPMVAAPSNSSRSTRSLARTKVEPTINAVGTPTPKAPTHPAYSWWDRVFAEIGSVTWRVFSRLFRFLGKLIWEVMQPILGWSERFITSILKFLIKLLLVVGLGWLVWTAIAQYKSEWIPKFDPIPKFKNPLDSLPKPKNPLDSLPKLKNPLDSLPKIELPSSQPSMAERKKQYKDRLKELGIDEPCLVEKVDAEFYNQHPELKGQSLNPQDPALLWMEWYNIADRLMEDPDANVQCKL
ncbi:MAG: hypothetical protein WCA35_17455, partial [Kovacikia sp.]